MISKDVVNAMIDLIDENIRLIEEIRSQGYESFSGNFRDIQAAKHSLQEAIEACLDIGSHIIAEKGFRRPEDYREIFRFWKKMELLTMYYQQSFKRWLSFESAGAQIRADRYEKSLYYHVR